MIAVNGVIFFITLGLLLVIMGFLVTTVDHANADEMLAFIRENNPGYYERLTSIEDRTYQKEFYGNYTVRGNSRITAAGMMLLFLTFNTAILLVFFANRLEIISLSGIIAFHGKGEKDNIGLTAEETPAPDNSEKTEETETN